MAKQLFNEFADIQALEKQKNQFVAMLDEMIKKQKEMQELGMSFSGSSKSINNTKDAAKVIDEQAKAIERLRKENEKMIIAQTEQYRNEQQLKQVWKETIREANLKAQATNELGGAYKRLEAEAALATQRFRDLAVQYGIESKEAKEAGIRAGELNQKLKDVDATVNLHQKNVGNYKDAAMSVRQEIRTLTQALAQMEMQGTANSKEAQVFRARLGELKDAMSDTQNKAKFFADDARWLNASVQAVQGLVGAYAAWNSVMVLTGSENEEVQKSMQKIQALLGVMMGLQQVSNMLQKDSMVIQAKNVIVEKLRALVLGAKTKALNEDTVAELANANASKVNAGQIAKTTGSVVESTGALKGAGTAASSVGASFGLVAAGSAAAVAALAGLVYGMITFNKSQLKAKEDTKEWKEQQQLLKEALNQTRAALNGTITSIGNYIESLRKRGKTEKDLINESIASAKLQAEALAQSYEAYGRNAIAERIDLEFQKKAIEQRKVYSKENEGLTLGEIQELNDLNMAIAEKRKTEKEYYASAREVRRAANETIYETIALIRKEEEAANAREESQKENTKAVNNERVANIALLKVLEQINQITVDIPTNLQRSTDALEQNSPLDKLFEQYKNGEITIQEFVSVSGQLLFDHQATYKEVQEGITKVLAEETARRNKIQQDGFNIASKLTQDTFNTISAYTSRSNEEVTNRITQQFDTSQEAIKNLLDAGVISQEEYNQRMKALEAARDKDLLEQKRKYAKQTRDLAAFQAIIQTAAAVVAQLATGVGPEAIASAITVGIMGAAEIAAIYAQPLPTFYKGTDNAPEGPAIVGDKYGYEYIQRGNDLFRTPNKATLTYLNSGDKVYTHSESIQLDKMLSLPVYKSDTSKNGNDMVLIGKFDELTEAVKNKPTAIINIDKNGYSFMLANGNRRVKYVNNHIRFSR